MLVSHGDDWFNQEKEPDRYQDKLRDFRREVFVRTDGGVDLTPQTCSISTPCHDCTEDHCCYTDGNKDAGSDEDGRSVLLPCQTVGKHRNNQDALSSGQGTQWMEMT